MTSFSNTARSHRDLIVTAPGGITRVQGKNSYFQLGDQGGFLEEVGLKVHPKGCM